MGSNGFAVTRWTVLLGTSAFTFGCVDSGSSENQETTEDERDETG